MNRDAIQLGDIIQSRESGVCGRVYSVFLGEGNLTVATIFTVPRRDDSLSGNDYITLPVDDLVVVGRTY